MHALAIYHILIYGESLVCLPLCARVYVFENEAGNKHKFETNNYARRVCVCVRSCTPNGEGEPRAKQEHKQFCIKVKVMHEI